MTIGDFNLDNKQDIAAANPSNGAVSLFIGNGNGKFQSVRNISLAGGSVPLAVVSGDFNNDKKPDLIVAFSPTDRTQAGGLAVLLGKGDGTFQAPAYITLPGPIIQQFTGSAPSAALALGDFNGDGKLDVVTAVVVTAADSSTSHQVAVLLGNGKGSFGTPLLTPTTTSPPMIAVTDENGDKKQDLLLTDCCGLSEGSFLEGNGDGTFLPELHVPSGPSPRGVAIGDFNGDGKPDAAVIGQVLGSQRGVLPPAHDQGTLAIVINKFTSFLPGSTTGDTTTTVGPVSTTFSPNAHSIRLSATVTSNFTPVSGGTVTFTLLGATASAAVTDGAASTNFMIPAGTAAAKHPMEAVYNPASGFTTSNDREQLTILKATPVITWPTPASIVSGTALSSKQLNATANVPGTFTYTPPSGSVLPAGNGQTLSVLFTPTNTTDYKTHTATVSINVTP